jgi:hypothetical protein
MTSDLFEVLRSSPAPLLFTNPKTLNPAVHHLPLKAGEALLLVVQAWTKDRVWV